MIGFYNFLQIININIFNWANFLTDFAAIAIIVYLKPFIGKIIAKPVGQTPSIFRYDI